MAWQGTQFACILKTSAYMVQDYIENENGRLEREQQFWSKEIVVKIEYKYCPNLTIIDTPGVFAHLQARKGAPCTLSSTPAIICPVRVNEQGRKTPGYSAALSQLLPR